MTSHGTPADPYRLFFPMGVAIGIVGVSIWPAYYFGLTDAYSGRAHAFVQIQGFLYSFIAGFLLTAIPRFTGTDSPRRSIQWTLAAIMLTTAMAFEFGIERWGHIGFLIAQGVVGGVVASRVMRRRNPPPETFPLIGIGLVTGFAGEVISAGIAWELFPPSLDLLGKRAMTEGMVLMLVLGVGGFLGPRLMGFGQIPDFQKMGGLVPKPGLSFFARRKSAAYALAGAAIALTLFLEYGLHLAWSSVIRAGVVTGVIFATMRPWRLPATRTTLSWSVWSSILLLVTGLWLSVLLPLYRVDFLHIVFIGGFTMLILAVGMRVTLSHGGHALAAEQRSWPLRIGAASITIAMLARVGAPFAPASFFDHLAFAGLLWILGTGIWGGYLMGLLRSGK